MRHSIFAVLALLLFTGPLAAQTEQTGSLGGRVELGDGIVVTDRSGVQTRGRLVGLSADQLTLLVKGTDRVILSDDIGRIEKRDSLWNGMLIGAVPGALIGMVGAGLGCSSHCGSDVPFAMLVTGAMGAGVGALIDLGIRGYSVVDGPSLPSPNARRTPAPVASLDELWLRVRQGDKIEVVTIRGEEIAGRFVQVSPTSVAIIVSGKRRDIPSREVHLVTRRGNRHRSGALWGGVIFGVVGGAIAAGEGGNPLLGAIAMGGSGAFWGAAIGAAIPKHPVIYEVNRSARAARARVTPVIGPSHVGVAFSASF